jgi:hypothetical protein
MALLKRGRGGTSNQLQIAAQGRYRLEGWNGAKLERVVGMKTGEAPTSLTIPHGDHLSGLRSEGCARISREAQYLRRRRRSMRRRNRQRLAVHARRLRR